MEKIFKPIKISRSSFSAYGDLISTDDINPMDINAGYAKRFDNLANLNTSKNEGKTIVSIFSALKRTFPMQIDMMEKHPLGSQAFIPMKETTFLAFVAPQTDKPNIEEIESFIIPPGTGINYKPGTWHFPLISTENMNFLIVDRQGPGNNLVIEDCCQALGAKVNDMMVGLQGDVGIFSFYATKLMTSGGQGGMFISKNKEYVDAARCLAFGNTRIMFKHILPNCMAPLIVVGTLQTAHAISLEATLSFLGLGLPITEPSLGLLIGNGFEYMYSGDFWISIFPGVALLITVASINLVGDHLRDMFNPRLH